MSTMYGILRGLGFRHNQPRHEAKRAYDPQAKAKMNAITGVLSSHVAGNHVIYEDESDIHLLPTLRSAWMLQGKQLCVPTPGANQKKSVFGALDHCIGAFIHRVFDRKRATEFLEFLAYIVAQYPTERIHIILDNFSIHEARSAGMACQSSTSKTLLSAVLHATAEPCREGMAAHDSGGYCQQAVWFNGRARRRRRNTLSIPPLPPVLCWSKG